MTKKKSRKVVDVKKAQAHDEQPIVAEAVVDNTTPSTTVGEVPNPVEVVKTKVATGAGLHVLAGRPSKPAVIACFGKSGYNLSWVARATKLDTTPEQLAADFKSDPLAVKARWEAAVTKLKVTVSSPASVK